MALAKPDKTAQAYYYKDTAFTAGLIQRERENAVEEKMKSFPWFIFAFFWKCCVWVVKWVGILAVCGVVAFCLYAVLFDR